MTTEIPVWVDSRQRWVAGVGRKTTCDEVIAVLLGGDKLPELRRQGYAIMERWRRVERPLDGRSRILRVWEAWGDERGEVRLTLKRVDWEADSGRGSPVASSSARRRKHRPGKLPWPACHETLHPRRLAQLQRHHHHPADSSQLPETIERLMRLILAQGQTLRYQLRRIQDRERQIETLEGETHRARVEELGSDYLLETYLGAGEAEEEVDDSGVATDQAASAAPGGGDPAPTRLRDLRARVDLLERLVRLNRRLEREEESLARLHARLGRLPGAALRLLPDEEWDEDARRSRLELLEALEAARDEQVRRAAELEGTALALAETDELLEARRCYLRRLQAELEAAEAPAGAGAGAASSSSPAPHTDTDSNSDTGLSSLHSSSEEGVYVLDTLV
ncbi:ras association domain-containing protein 10 [Bacillus rossius redtenbacheri]|uniref:ras association domain-containing protein 10 n=1 Tax=Bacillus rossius redtenbacheri TaxID=93214 RepID=UPI002FDD6D18